MTDNMSSGGQGTYWLTRIVFLRCLGCIYLVAFLVALDANEALLGENGLLPATRYMSRLQNHFRAEELSVLEKVLKVPTVFWFAPPTADNLWTVAAVGAGVSSVVVLTGASNFPMMALLWGLYHSLINVGQTWYSYGWESQLLETGFLAMFLVPWWSLSPLPRGSPPPTVCIWGYRWLLFRIMLGAGLIKVRGDQCWRDLTCMDYHYQTQPNPNPLAPYLHHLPPPAWHKFEVLVNHVVELIIPWGLLLVRPVRAFSGLIQILFQVALVLSGNLSFLNWLTALPAIFSFDDSHLQWLFSAKYSARASRAAAWVKARNAYVLNFRGAGKPQAPELQGGETHTDSGSGSCSIGDVPPVEVASANAATTGTRVGDLDGDGGTSALGEMKTDGLRRRHRKGEAGIGNESMAGFVSEEAEQEEWERRGGDRWVGQQRPRDERLRPGWHWLCRVLLGMAIRSSASLVLLFLVLKGSIPVVKNLSGQRQLMNTSFDSLRIVNTYGAFGSITKERGEIILKGTRHHDPFDPAAEWREYEFKCKPGGVDVRPCVITPFHYRLDWQMWFAAFQNFNMNPWLVNMVAKLLSPDVSTRALIGKIIRKDPFMKEETRGGGDGTRGQHGGPPKFIKADLYRYTFTKPGSSPSPVLPPLEADGRPSESGPAKTTTSSPDKGRWWAREFVRPYLPPLSLDNESLPKFLRGYGLEQEGR